MPGPIDRQSFKAKVKEGIEQIPAAPAMDLAAFRTIAAEAFEQQDSEIAFFEDATFEAEVEAMLQTANREGLGVDEIKVVLDEVRRHVAIQANFDATRAHEAKRSAAKLNIFKHFALNMKEMATVLGGGLAADVRTREAAIGQDGAGMKALMESAIELGVMRRRIKRYLELGGAELSTSLDAFKSGEVQADHLLDTHDAKGKLYDKGLDKILASLNIEVGAGKMFHVDGLGDIEVPDEATKQAIQHHLKFILRTEIIKLVEAQQLTVLSSDDYEIKNADKGVLSGIGKRIVSSGTFWGVTTRVGTRLALGGAIGAAGLAGGAAVAGGVLLGIGAGAAAAYVRERVNATERFKRRKLEAAVGAVDNNLAKPASELNADMKKGVAAIQAATTPDAKFEAVKKTFKATTEAQHRLQQTRVDKQDYISFGLENRFQAQKQLLDNIEKSLAAVTNAFESLSAAQRSKLRSDLITMNSDVSSAVLQSKEHFVGLVTAEESRRRSRAAVIGGLAGGFGSLVAHYAMEAFSGHEPATAASTPLAEPTPVPPRPTTPEVPAVSATTPEVPAAATVPPVEPTATATTPVNFSEQMFADPETAKLLDAMGLQQGELQYDPNTKLFHIPDGALRDAAGKLEYLGRTEGWRARRMEFILKAMAEGKANESPEMIVARAERATSNLLLTKGSLHNDPDAAFNEAFSKDAGFIQKNVMPWVDGTRSRISSRWMKLVAEMKEGSTHPAGTPAVEPTAATATPGAAADQVTPPTVEQTVATQVTAAAAEISQPFVIDQQMQKVGMMAFAIMGAGVWNHGIADQVAHQPDRRNEFMGDADHEVVDTPLEDIPDYVARVKAETLAATHPERAHRALVEIKKTVVDADAAIAGDIAALKPTIDAINSGASVDVSMIDTLIAQVAAVGKIATEVGKAKAVLGKKEPDFTFAEIDHDQNSDALASWITQHEGFLNVETNVKTAVEQMLRGVVTEITEMRKKPDDEVPPDGRKQQLETVLLPKLDLVDKVKGLVPAIITDAAWPATLEAQRDAAKVEVTNAILMIDFTELFGKYADLKSEVFGHLKTAGVIDDSDLSLPVVGKGDVIKKLMDEVTAKSYTKDKAGLISMGFMKKSVTKPVGDEQKKRIKEVLDRLVAGESDIFRT